MLADSEARCCFVATFLSHGVSATRLHGYCLLASRVVLTLLWQSM